MMDYFEETPVNLRDSILELLVARSKDAYHGILDIDKDYSENKALIESHIANLRKADPTAAESLEKAIRYVEDKITLNLYNKGLKDGQELHLLASNTIEINC
jgi:hypothetical protein